MQKIKIGIIGLGTVGTGVYKNLKKFDNIEIVKIGLQNLRHGSGHRGITHHKHRGRPKLLALVRNIQIQRKDQKQQQHHQIVESNRVHIHIIYKEIANISVTVNEAGIDHHQQKHRHTQAGCNRANRLPMLALVERKHRHHIQKQRAEM